jgi:hypothetical protein
VGNIRSVILCITFREERKHTSHTSKCWAYKRTENRYTIFFSLNLTTTYQETDSWRNTSRLANIQTRTLYILQDKMLTPKPHQESVYNSGTSGLAFITKLLCSYVLQPLKGIVMATIWQKYKKSFLAWQHYLLLSSASP